MGKEGLKFMLDIYESALFLLYSTLVLSKSLNASFMFWLIEIAVFLKVDLLLIELTEGLAVFIIDVIPVAFGDL